jgi:predicted nucleic acid-binding protein
VSDALAILDRLLAGELIAVQPSHWLAEVAAILARRLPDSAQWLVERLIKMNLDVLDTVEIYQDAIALARKTGAHLFDTLYHATTRQVPESIFITADERYYRANDERDQIILLKNWRTRVLI